MAPPATALEEGVAEVASVALVVQDGLVDMRAQLVGLPPVAGEQRCGRRIRRQGLEGELAPRSISPRQRLAACGLGCSAAASKRCSPRKLCGLPRNEPLLAPSRSRAQKHIP